MSNLYRDLVDGAPDILFALAPDGRFTTLNAAFERITGEPVCEWLGHSIEELVERDLAELLELSTAEVTVRCKRGMIVLDLSLTARDGQIYGIARDITARRKQELQRERDNRIASLGRLAGTIAHDFNNVLMGIAPFVEVMRKGRNIEMSLDHISKALARGRRITQDIQRLNHSAQPSRTAVDVAQWLQGIALEALTPAHTIELKCEENLHIDGDPAQLQQILTNLILNARDAMPSGGQVTVEVRRDLDRPFAHLLVRDTGCGMNEELLRHAFEPLFTTKRNATGLGLPVALQIVQRHGGEMLVESTPGAGTTFHIFLPLAAAPAAMLAVDAA